MRPQWKDHREMKKVLAILSALALIPFGAWAQTALDPDPIALACAFNTVAPSPIAGNFYYVQCDANGKLITSGTAVTPGGANTQVQFNDNGAFGGNASLVFNKTTGVTTVSSIASTNPSVFALGTAALPGIGLGLSTVGIYSDGSKNVFITNGSQTWTFAAGSGGFNSSGVANSAGSTFAWVGRSQIFSPADSVIGFRNNAGAAFQQLDFGGTTSAFGAIGTSSTPSLEFRTADQTSGANAYYHWGGQSRAAAQFDVTSSVTLANVPGLTVNVTAAKTYSFNATIYTTSNIAGGVQAAIGGTATATAIIYEGETTAAAAVGAQTRATALGTTVGGITTVTVARIDIVGTITVNAGGTLTVQFAQNASSGSASSVLVGSTFNVMEFP